MKPQSPVILGFEKSEILIAEDQKNYEPLPSLRIDDTYILSRWKMKWWERLVVLIHGDVYLWVQKDVYTPLQPVMLQVTKPV